MVLVVKAPFSRLLTRAPRVRRKPHPQDTDAQALSLKELAQGDLSGTELDLARMWLDKSTLHNSSHTDRESEVAKAGPIAEDEFFQLLYFDIEEDVSGAGRGCD